MHPTRRAALKYGLFGAGLLTWAGLGRRALASGSALEADQRAVLLAAALRITPGGDGAPDPRALDLGPRFDATLAPLHPADVEEIGLLLTLLDSALVGLLFDLRPRGFVDSPPEVQDAILEAWRTSGLTVRKKGFKALHNLCSAVYWGCAETWAYAGYAGPPDYGNLRDTSPRWDDAEPPSARETGGGGGEE